MAVEIEIKDDPTYPCFILVSPDGKRWKLKVGNDGVLSTEEIV